LQHLRGWVWAPDELEALLAPVPALLPSEPAQVHAASNAASATPSCFFSGQKREAASLPKMLVAMSRLRTLSDDSPIFFFHTAGVA
jgi:hypothetical protein